MTFLHLVFKVARKTRNSSYWTINRLLLTKLPLEASGLSVETPIRLGFGTFLEGVTVNIDKRSTY